MATRCTGKRCSYGYGHHREHVEAAKLGWQRRKYGEARYLGMAFRGYEVHSHQRGKVILRDTEDDTHFELSAAEARQVIGEVRERERSQQRQQRLAEQAERARQRAAKLQALHREREARRAIREAERAERDAQRVRDAEDRYARRVESELFQNAISEVVGYGGIRNYKKDSNGQRVLQEDVWQQIPRYYRASSRNTTAKTADEVASELAERFPYLGIETDSDLAQAFATRRFKARERKTAAKVAA